MTTRISTEVAIVGLGPVGATLANLLGARGIDVVAIEREPEVHPRPRAISMDHEAMRIFQAVGLAERILPHTVIFDRSVYIGLEGRMLQQLVTAPPPFETHWCPNYLFSQPALDRVLRDGAIERATVRGEIGTDVTGIRNEPHAAIVEARRANGELIEIEAQYVVACDGGSSPIRRSLDIGFDDLEFDEPWIVVDALIDPSHLLTLPTTNVQYCEPSRPSTHVMGPGNHRRWEIMLLPGETPDEMSREERIWQLLARWISPDNAKLWRAAAYRFHALVAKEWTKGRVIIAGDAAHMTPPFLGQGMCQGLRDTSNIAWKLEAILRRGVAPEPLLATYMQERSPHVRATTNVSKRLGRIICELDMDKARARDAQMLEHGEGREHVRQNLIPGLKEGILSTRAPSPAVGTIFPQPLVTIGNGDVKLDDVTSGTFRLVARPEIDLSACADAPEISRLGISLVQLAATPDAATAPRSPVIKVVERNNVLSAWMAKHNAVAALVRPDHYVFGVAADAAGTRALVGELGQMLA